VPNIAGCKKKLQPFQVQEIDYIMPSDKNPVFRKAIIPWYHSKTAYSILIIFMLLVFLFGLAGISVARANVQFTDHIWVPITLVIFSGIIIMVSIIRLIRRHAAK
jgi:hypothetical protein